ncbi:MAG: 50S ribosomal protein L25 [Dethiobacteria bacterium]|jgi:large subunit ribosomal protein L25
MERFKIEAIPRELGTKGELKESRAKGLVPAVVYGRGETILISLGSQDIKRALSTAAGLNVLLDLEIKGGNGTSAETVMIKALQKHPIKQDTFIHVDLIRISLKDKLEINVPLNFIGEPAGAKEGGILQIQLREISIRCLPGDIPEHIDVPVDGLNIGDVITVADLTLPEDVEILNEPTEDIASVLAPHVEEEEEEVEGEEIEPGVEGEDDEQEKDNE